MLKKAAFALLLIGLFAFNIEAAEMIDNEYYSLEVPDGWDATPLKNTEKIGLNQNIIKQSGNCLININIMPYSGSALEVIRQISKTMAGQGIIMGELRQDGPIHYCRFKKKENSGILYVGANGSEAALLSIYGSSKLQREAERMLKGFKAKKDAALFPSFD